MTVNGVGYYAFAAVAVLAAVGVVGFRSLHRAAYALAGFGVGAGLLFLLLGNELLFAAELLVGGIAVPALVLVALELTGARGRADVRESAFTKWWPAGLAAACGIGALLLGVDAVSGGSWVQGGGAPNDLSVTRQMGQLIFQNYALPFAVAAVLLLTALVGAVLTARRDDLEAELEAAEESRRRREDRMRRRREDRERARRAQRPAAVGAGDEGEED